MTKKAKKKTSLLPHDKHDNFTRLMLSEPETLKNFVQRYLPPQLLVGLDLDSMEALSEHLIDDHLQKQVTDLIVKVKKDEKDAYLYFVVEFKATPDKLSALQAMSYAMQIMLKYADAKKDKPIPLVYPLILYHGKKKFEHSTDLRVLMDATAADVRLVFDDPMYLIDLSATSDEDILHHSQFPLCFIELVLKHVFDDDLLQTLENWQEFLGLFKHYTNEFGQEKAFVILRYLYGSGNIKDRGRFTEIVSVVDRAFKEEIMTLQQAAEQVGEQRGEKRGIQIGEKRGIFLMARKMLAMGESVEKIAMISGLSIEELQQLTQQQQDFKTN